MKRKGRLLAGIALAVPALSLLLAAAVVARLAWGPVSLDRLAGPAERRVEAAVPGLEVSFARLAVFWDRQESTLELRLGDAVAAFAPAGWRAAIPELALALEIAPLFAGDVRPKALIARGVEASLEWRASDLAVGGEDFEGAPALVLPPPLVRGLAGLVVPGTPAHELLAGLETASLEEGTLTLVETGSGEVRRLLDAGLSLARDSDGVVLEGGGRLGEGDVRLTGRLARNGALRLSLNLSGLVPGRLAQGIDMLAAVSGVAMPVDAELDMEADRGGSIGRIALRVEAGEGTLTLPADYPDPIAIDALRAVAAYDGASRRLEIEELAAEFAGQTFFASGSAMIPNGAQGPELNLAGGFGPLDIGALVTYWPRIRAADARRWIAERLPRGVVSDARFEFALLPEDRDRKFLPAEALQLSFGFDGLDGHYLPPMPPLEGASGRGRLTASSLRLDIAQGVIDGVSAAGSAVTLERLQETEQWGDIELHLAASLSDLLRLVDHQPLGYARDFGIAPGDVSGEAALRARLGLPLLRDVTLGEIEIAVQTDIANLEIPAIAGEEGLKDGRLRLEIDRAGLEGRGHATLAGIAFDLDWREDFTAPEGTSSSLYLARGSVSADDLRRIGLDPGQRLAGRIGLDLRLEGAGRELHHGELTADLLDAQVELPELAWSKMPGTPARLVLAATPIGEARLRLDVLDFRSGPDEVRARDVEIDSSARRLVRAVVDRLKLGRTDLSLTMENPADGTLSLDMKGASFDAAPLLAEFDIGSVGADEQPARVRPLEIDFQIGKVFGLEGEMFEDMAVRAVRDDRMWRHMSLSARLEGGGAVSASLDPAPDGEGRIFVLGAGNLGRTLKGSGLFDNVEGGRLELDARLSGHGPDVVIDGQALLEDFRLVRRERVDANIEEEARSRLDDLIDGGGMRFDEMVLPFRLSDGIIDLDNAHANGPRLGLTIEGQVDKAMERVNINGLIVPAYWLNSILGNIPLLGNLFTGGEGGGLFALSYRIKGSTDDPEVSVNALTAIMPGILRRPFEGSKGRIEPPGERPEEPPD